MRRLLLVSNPGAYGFRARDRDALLRLLSARFKLEEASTERPGHGLDLAREAALDGVEVVAAHGGDGTVNEVANGLAGSDASLAVLPAGMANVFARAVGLPDQPLAAGRHLAENGGAASRRIPLGRVEGRFFIANCGLGLDAAVVRAVERRPQAKRRGGDWYYLWTALRVFLAGYDRTRPSVWIGQGGPASRRDRLFLAIVQNVDPYTYFRGRGMRLSPGTTLEGGLDCLGLDSLAIRVTLPLVAASFRGGAPERAPHLVRLRNRDRLVIGSDRPLPLQADGEYLGERTMAMVESVPNALALLV